MGRGRMVLRAARWAAFAFCWFIFFTQASADGLPVVINEVFYDPPGKDDGREFVELFNRSDSPVCLEWWQFETGNGAYESRWRHEWMGSGSDTIPALGFFVIGEELTGAAADFITDLDLQNGPDGCRITGPDGRSDVVGWGDLAYQEYYEGCPAERASSGASIGRDPDGSDSDSNSGDFAVFELPSPGDYNHPPCDLAIERAALAGQPSIPGAAIDIVCRTANTGTRACGAGTRLYASIGAAVDSSFMGCDLDPDEARRVIVRLPHPGEGLHPVRAWLGCCDDRWHANDSLSTSIALHPPPVVINEIMFKPATDDCEWIELLLRKGQPLDLEAWTVEDHRGRARAITESNLVLGEGDFIVLADDFEAFLATHADLSGVRVIEPTGGWPGLNDADGPFGFADAVVVRDAFGTVVDSVAYAQAWSSPGVSVERIDPGRPATDPANWSPHYGMTAGSPGQGNSVSFYLPESGGILSLSPRTFEPGSGGETGLLAISVDLPQPCIVSLVAYDLEGRLVRHLIDATRIEDTRRTLWDGRRDDGTDAPMGVYVLLVRANGTASGEAYTAKAPVVLVRR
jgi:hypothetical protein